MYQMYQGRALRGFCLTMSLLEVTEDGKGSNVIERDTGVKKLLVTRTQHEPFLGSRK